METEGFCVSQGSERAMSGLVLVYLFMYMNILSASMSVHRVCAVPPEVRRGGLGPLELDSQKFVSHYLGAGN